MCCMSPRPPQPQSASISVSSFSLLSYYTLVWPTSWFTRWKVSIDIWVSISSVQKMRQNKPRISSLPSNCPQRDCDWPSFDSGALSAWRGPREWRQVVRTGVFPLLSNFGMDGAWRWERRGAGQVERRVGSWKTGSQTDKAGMESILLFSSALDMDISHMTSAYEKSGVRKTGSKPRRMKKN